MRKKIVLEVKNLGKRFKVYPSSWGRIKEWLTLGRHSYHKDFWSLKEVTFKVHKGEFLGIIGPNGAGKSTLLKVITGVLEPTTGSYKTSGRVLSLLELSGGLDGNLTGRENIIRMTHLLGFPNDYAENRMKQIADFAELGEFFDRPLETYSSGMRVRLAFSMFAFLDCDILILDEVLAVGDIFFKQKCYARLEELIKRNTAIIFVTQSTGVVSHYCDSVIVMEKGRIIHHGDPAQGIQKYFETKSVDHRIKARDTYIEEDYLQGSDSPLPGPAALRWPPEKQFARLQPPPTPPNAGAVLSHLLICDEKGRPKQVFKQGEKVFFYYAYRIKENMGVPIVELNLTTVKNAMIHGKNSLQKNTRVPLRIRSNNTIRIRQSVKLDIAPGNYVCSLGLYSLHPDDYTRLGVMTPLEFKEKRAVIAKIKQAGMILVVPSGTNQAVGVHSGLCDLEGELHLSVLDEAKQKTKKV